MKYYFGYGTGSKRKAPRFFLVADYSQSAVAVQRLAEGWPNIIYFEAELITEGI